MIRKNRYNLNLFFIVSLVAWVFICLGSCIHLAYNERSKSQTLALSQARAVLGRDMAFRKWNSVHGGVYTVMTDTNRPNPYLNVENREIPGPDGITLTKINPAYMIRQVNDLVKSDSDVSVRLTSLKPLNPINAPDEWEAESLRLFDRGRKENSVINHSVSPPSLRLIKPLLTQASCLSCHEEQGYKVGDIRGAISLTTSIKDFRDATEKNILINCLIYVFIFLIGLLSVLIARRKFLKEYELRSHAQSKLLINEVRFRELFNNMNSGVIVCCSNSHDKSGYTVVDFNRNAEAILGITKRELVNKSLITFLPNIKELGLLGAIHRVCNSGVAENVPTYPFKKENDTRYFTSFIYKLPNGEIVILFNDVTEAVEQSMQVGENKERIEQALSASKAGLWDWNIITGELIVDSRWAEISGYTLEELEPISVKTRNQMLHKDDMKLFELSLLEHMDGKTEYYECELRINHKNGKSIWIYDSGKVVSWDEDNNPVRMIGTYIDITERKEQVKELERLWAAVDQVPSSIAIMDTNGVIEYVNDAFSKFTGQSKGEVLGKSIESLEGYGSIDLEEVWSIVRSGSVWQGELLKKENGSDEIYWELSTIAPIKNEFGDLTGFVSINENITELKNTSNLLIKEKQRLDILAKERYDQNKELEAASKLKSEFLANASHELRTPLNGILGYAQVLRKEKSLARNVQGAVNVIYYSANHLLELINDILDLSKIDASKMEITPKKFYLNSFLDSTLKMVESKYQGKAIKLSLEVDKDINMYVNADEQRLRQIILNLLSNAMKYTNEGAVTLTVTKEDNLVRFSVADTGVGIPEERLDYIFDPFIQLADFYRSVEGTGLGLSISSKLVSLMDGELKVESTEGVGSKFWFDLDLEEVEGSSVGQERDTVIDNVLGYEGEKQKILIVDDVEINREVLSIVLEDATFDVLEANSGESAVEMFKEHRPDLIFMDIMMPGIGGIEAVRQIRKIEKEEDCDETTHIVALSALASEEEINNTVKAGCDSYISKPFEQSKVFETIGSLLNLEFQYFSQEIPDTNYSEEELNKAIEEIPDEIVKSLIYAAEIGSVNRINSVLDEVENIETESDVLKLFVEAVREYADEFEFGTIIQMLKGKANG